MFTSFTKLFRIRLALLNGVTAVGGYCLFPAAHRHEALLAAFCGVVLLAMGGSAINQLLERDIDALMARTMQRPLPQGTLSATEAAIAGCCVILAGFVLLAACGGLLPPLLGGVALLWYLAVYTPLKRKTTLALPLGALCGAAPPLIGWSMAGGDPADFRIIILAGVLFIWQMPHFWLLQERHAADYRRAGIPLVMNRAALPGLWLVALVAAALLLPAFGVIGKPSSMLLAAFSASLLLLALLRAGQFFFYLNLFPVVITLVLLV
jgi:protoheme IX farnesyltransferase